MVWAIEYAVPTRLGTSRPGHEAIADRPALPPAPTGGPLRYRVQTTVPRHWMPLVPVQIDSSSEQIALELAGLLADGPVRSATPARPIGRLLNPQPARPGAYRVREEEVPRTGVRVLRLPYSSRWTNGATHLWWARRRSAGGGEGSSGLRFDVGIDV